VLARLSGNDLLSEVEKGMPIADVLLETFLRLTLLEPRFYASDVRTFRFVRQNGD
jgi:hypothetical protein